MLNALETISGALSIAAWAVLSGGLYANASKFFLARKRFRTYALVALAYDFLPYAAFVSATTFGADLPRAMLSYVLTDAVIALTIALFVARTLPFRAPSTALLLRYFRYSAPLALSELEGGLLTKADRFFLAYFCDLSHVAIYNIIVSLFRLFDGLSAPVRRQLMSYLPAVWDRGHQQESIAFLRQSVLLYSAVTLGLIGACAAHIDPILSLLTHQSTSIPALHLSVILLGTAALLANVRRFYNQLIKLNENSLHVLWYQLGGLIPNLALNLLLVPELGVLGAAIASASAYGLVLLFMSRGYSLAADLRFVATLSALVTLSVCIWLPQVLLVDAGLMELVLYVGVGMLVYLGASLALVPSLYRTFLSSAATFGSRL